MPISRDADQPGWTPRLIVSDTQRTSGPRPLRRPATKREALTRLLRRRGGASIGELVSASGWQRHSVHSWLSGVRKLHRRHLHRLTCSDGINRYALRARSEAKEGGSC